MQSGVRTKLRWAIYELTSCLLHSRNVEIYPTKCLDHTVVYLQRQRVIRVEGLGSRIITRNIAKSKGKFGEGENQGEMFISSRSNGHELAHVPPLFLGKRANIYH